MAFPALRDLVRAFADVYFEHMRLGDYRPAHEAARGKRIDTPKTPVLRGFGGI